LYIKTSFLILLETRLELEFKLLAVILFSDEFDDELLMLFLTNFDVGNLLFEDEDNAAISLSAESIIEEAADEDEEELLLLLLLLLVLLVVLHVLDEHDEHDEQVDDDEE
jgi:hypothetical protein